MIPAAQNIRGAGGDFVFRMTVDKSQFSRSYVVDIIDEDDRSGVSRTGLRLSLRGVALEDADIQIVLHYHVHDAQTAVVLRKTGHSHLRRRSIDEIDLTILLFQRQRLPGEESVDLRIRMRHRHLIDHRRQALHHKLPGLLIRHHHRLETAVHRRQCHLDPPLRRRDRQLTDSAGHRATEFARHQILEEQTCQRHHQSWQFDETGRYLVVLVADAQLLPLGTRLELGDKLAVGVGPNRRNPRFPVDQDLRPFDEAGGGGILDETADGDLRNVGEVDLIDGRVARIENRLPTLRLKGVDEVLVKWNVVSPLFGIGDFSGMVATGGVGEEESIPLVELPVGDHPGFVALQYLQLDRVDLLQAAATIPDANLVEPAGVVLRIDFRCLPRQHISA